MGRAKIEGVRERLRSVYRYFTLSEQLLIPFVVGKGQKSVDAKAQSCKEKLEIKEFNEITKGADQCVCPYKYVCAISL
jgi:hypothetical protein